MSIAIQKKYEFDSYHPKASKESIREMTRIALLLNDNAIERVTRNFTRVILGAGAFEHSDPDSDSGISVLIRYDKKRNPHQYECVSGESSVFIASTAKGRPVVIYTAKGIKVIHKYAYRESNSLEEIPSTVRVEFGDTREEVQYDSLSKLSKESEIALSLLSDYITDDFADAIAIEQRLLKAEHKAKLSKLSLGMRIRKRIKDSIRKN